LLEAYDYAPTNFQLREFFSHPVAKHGRRAQLVLDVLLILCKGAFSFHSVEGFTGSKINYDEKSNKIKKF